MQNNNITRVLFLVVALVLSAHCFAQTKKSFQEDMSEWKQKRIEGESGIAERRGD
jgi:hypothetical protein